MEDTTLSDCSIITNITRINDLHLRLIEFLPVQQVIALAQVSKYYYAVHNEVHVWKRLLKREFNWPPVRRGKGSKKLKNTNEMNLTELKAVLIQKYKDKYHVEDEAVLLGSMKNLFSTLYTRLFVTNRYYPVENPCPHPTVRFAPTHAKRPSYFGCEQCLLRLELDGGLTKGQIGELFKNKKLTIAQLYLTLCRTTTPQLWEVPKLDQLRFHYEDGTWK